MYAWGASGDVRPDAAAGAFPALLLHLQDEGVRRLADPGQGAPAQGGCPLVRAVLLPDALVRNTPAVLPSAA